MATALETTCCVVGGGPAGMMLGLLLARAGVDVIVLEKHKDFFRDFRGDTIHPATLGLMHELGWLDDLLAVKHQRIDTLSAMIGGRAYPLPDFTHLPTAAKYIALMPQWDFLDFLAEKARQFPSFRLLMEHEVTGLISINGRIVGAHATTPDGAVDVHAVLTVGCDGRHAATVPAAHLEVIERGVPLDVLWFRVSRRPGDPENALGYINNGRVAILIDRDDYFQIGYVIRKGTFPKMQAAGVEAFRAALADIVPFLAVPDPSGHKRLGEITDLSQQIKLLTVQINHLRRWHAPGLLCIGDAAHAMSPVGGVGINLAIQDAVAAANILAKPLLVATTTRPVPENTLAMVQHHRQWAVRLTQYFQAVAHKAIERIFNSTGTLHAPWIVRFVSGSSLLRRFVGRAIGMGAEPEHIHSPQA